LIILLYHCLVKYLHLILLFKCCSFQDSWKNASWFPQEYQAAQQFST